MKKIIVLLALCMPLVGYANGGKLSPKVLGKARQALQNAPTTWKSLNRGLLLSLDVSEGIGIKGVAEKVAQLRKGFSARENFVAANPQQFKTLLHRAQGSSLGELSSLVTDKDLMDLFFVDAYGSDPKTEFVTLPQYTQGERPTVVTKQDFYVKVNVSGNEPNIYEDVFIPAGSEVQLAGKLAPQAGTSIVSDWIEYVASRRHLIGGLRAEELRSQVKQALLPQDFTFTLQEVTDLMASPEADKVFSPAFMMNSAGRYYKPAVVSRIPLRIMDGRAYTYPAGTVFGVSRAGSKDELYGEYLASPIEEFQFLKPVNDRIEEVRHMPMELFVSQRAVDGKVVYHPKMLMLWRDEELRILTPQNTLRIVNKGTKQILKLVDEAISLDEFCEAAKVELPKKEELLANLPEQSTSWKVFDLDEVGRVELSTDRLGWSMDDVYHVFGYHSGVYDKVGMEPITIEDLQAESDRLAKERGLPSMPGYKRTPKRSVTRTPTAPVRTEEATPVPPVATSQTTNVAPLQEPVKPKGVSMDAKVPNRIPKGIDPKWVDSEPAVFYDKHDRSNSRKRFVVWEVVEGFKLPDGTVANKKDYVQDRDGKIIVYSGAVFRNNYVRAF